MISGVAFKDLVTHADERGFFREIIRVTDAFFAEGFGQWSHSLVYPGVVKAWHTHKVQTQWTYVACGLLKVALHDCRPDSPTYRETMEFLAGDNQSAYVYRLPQGWRMVTDVSTVRRIYFTSHPVCMISQRRAVFLMMIRRLATTG